MVGRGADAIFLSSYETKGPKRTPSTAGTPCPDPQHGGHTMHANTWRMDVDRRIRRRIRCC